MEAFVNEPNYTVWSDLSCNLGILGTLLSHTDFYEDIQVFVRDVFSPIGERLGWDPRPGEGHLDALLRGLVLGKLGKAGHKATLEEARRRFKEHVEGKHVLSADLRSPVYVTVLKHGDSSTLDTMLKLHKQADMQEEKNRIERVLGAISQPELIQKVLTFALSEEVRPQDTVSVIGGVAGGSKQGRKAAWKFVRDNWEELYNRYQGGFLISRLIKLTVDGFANDKMAAEVKATDARRAFPCWDEPAIKATFDISLVVPKDRVALSNMNVVERRPYPDDESLVEVKFARSPVMSTYLVAFVVGEYDFVEARSQDGVLVAAKTLPFYKDYFNVPYPLPKIDLIAIADFAAGAMENWGLVTYRETALLIDPKNSCSSSRQWVALVVGHELAHQWFGNLVTMEWWTHLWLNEGFASWIEYLCVDHCFPEYDIWTQFVSADYTRAQELDALDNSHPIEVSVGHPSEVDEIFDAISYSKGASVIRMLHDYIGDEDFRKGMNLYLTKFQQRNAATEDLWESLEKASGKPIAAVMNTWTKQMGFPLIYVEAEQQEDDKVLKLVQKKFCASGPYTGEDFPMWMVPISICTSEDPSCAKMQILMDKPELTVVLKDTKPEQWVKVKNATNQIVMNCADIDIITASYAPEGDEGGSPACFRFCPGALIAQ
ncbi:hypothetical protein EK904_005134 [Melospiza melodia maxima]|nr:hypothetical protein EK904_005134 [Melospiza melodia maxima]